MNIVTLRTLGFTGVFNSTLADLVARIRANWRRYLVQLAFGESKPPYQFARGNDGLWRTIELNSDNFDVRFLRQLAVAGEKVNYNYTHEGSPNWENGIEVLPMQLRRM